MKGAIVLLAAVSLTCVFYKVKGDENDTSIEDELRLRNNVYSIIQLEEQLNRIKKKLRKNVVDVEELYHQIETVVDRLEGSGCKENEFQCGSEGRHGHECIQELLVCDGFNDCHNGQDEDPKYCDVSKIRPGLSFSGYFTEGRCGGQSRKSFFCKLILVSTERYKAYPAVMYLKAYSYCNMTTGETTENPKSTIMEWWPTGTYHIANRKWHSEAAGYSSDCYFTDRTFRSMWCTEKQGTTDCKNDMLIFRDE